MEKRITVIAKITSACNLDCPYCYTRSTIRNGSYMKIDTFKKIVREVAMNYDSAEIIFHGGEPTLLPYEWFEEAIKYIEDYEKMYNMKISKSIQTNLTNYDKKKFDLLLKKKVNIGFSYDGMTNDKTRKNDELIINNYNKIKSEKNKPGSICLVTANNYKNLKDEVKLFTFLGIHSRFNIVFNTTTMVDNVNKIEYNVLLEQYKWLIDDIIETEEHMFYDTFSQHFTHVLGGRCGLCKNIDCREKWISVHPDGNYYPCGQEWRQKNEHYLLGNINSDTFKDAFNSEAFKKFSNKIDEKNEKCKECEIFDFCNGGCPGESFSNTGEVNGKLDEECDFEIEIIRYIKEKLKDKSKIKNKIILRQIKED